MFLHTWKVSLGFRALVSFDRHSVEEPNPVLVIVMNLNEFLLNLMFEPQLVKWIFCSHMLTHDEYTVHVYFCLQKLNILL